MAIKVYHALDAPEALAKYALQKIETVRTSRRSTDMARRLHRNWLMYYGLNDWKASLSDNLYAEGSNGERVALRANHARNIIQHMLELTTASRPDFKSRAANMDIKSIKQTQIADSIIEHYLSFEGIWKFIDMAIEQALTLHGGFIHAYWDATKGEPWAALPGQEDNPGMIAYQGDFVFRNPSLFDVIFDQIATSWEEIQEIIVRDWFNKYDLMQKYPEFESVIDKQKTKREWEVYDSLPLVFFTSDDSIQIELHTYYHERTSAVPSGRRTLFLSDGTVLEDGPLPYDVVPVFRVVASETMGTPHGWCPLTEVASLQEAVNKSLSTIATNQFAFGVQNIWAPRGSRLEVSQLTGGMNLIEGSPVGPNGGKPEVLQLLNTPPEILEFSDVMVKTMETLSGVNQVVRGNPESGLTAGVALALVSTQSLQFLSPLQRSYAEATRDLLMFIVNTLKERATTPRLLHITGKGKREALKYFTAQDIDGINRVSYELGNPMTRTPAGRMQLAQMIVEAGVQVNVTQLLEIMDKGRIEPLIKGNIDQLDNILLENEDLLDGMPWWQPGDLSCGVVVGDDDRLHIQEHISLLANPDIRRNPTIAGPVAAHITAHANKYMMGDRIQGIIQGMITPGFMPPMPTGPDGQPQQGPGGRPGGGQPPGHQESKGGRKAPPEKKNGQDRLPEPPIQQMQEFPRI